MSDQVRRSAPQPFTSKWQKNVCQGASLLHSHRLQNRSSLLSGVRQGEGTRTARRSTRRRQGRCIGDRGDYGRGKTRGGMRNRPPHSAALYLQDKEAKKHGITKSETNRMVRGKTEAPRQQRKPKGDRSRRVRHERYRISAGDPKDR